MMRLTLFLVGFLHGAVHEALRVRLRRQAGTVYLHADHSRKMGRFVLAFDQVASVIGQRVFNLSQ